MNDNKIRNLYKMIFYLVKIILLFLTNNLKIYSYIKFKFIKMRRRTYYK